MQFLDLQTEEAGKTFIQRVVILARHRRFHLTTAQRELLWGVLAFTKESLLLRKGSPTLSGSRDQGVQERKEAIKVCTLFKNFILNTAGGEKLMGPTLNMFFPETSSDRHPGSRSLELTQSKHLWFGNIFKRRL